MSDDFEFKRVDLGNGVIYEGEIENGNRFVFGKYSLPNITYIGEFNEESDMEGIGKLSITTKDGKIIRSGIFKGKAPNGLPLLNGSGTTYYFLSNIPKEMLELNGGIKYEEGLYLNNQLHGQAAIYYNDGSKYEGEFSHGKMHGKGKKINSDGSIITREYDNGRAISIE